MNLDDRLDRARDELADEVASGVRVPSFDGVLARRARRRLQVAAGGAALVVVAAGVVGGVAATRPTTHRSAPPIATVSASRPPTSPPTTAPTASSTVSSPVNGPQTYPAKGVSYVVVPDGDQLAWTDLKTGAHGHFGPADGSQLSDPSVSADGRRVAYRMNPEHGIAVWDLDTRTAQQVMPPKDIETSLAISPDGTKVLWTEHTVIMMADVGAPSSAHEVTADGSPAAWDGNDAIAYLDYGVNQGGQCAVMRLDLTTKATRCLLPVATLQSVFAPDGSSWRINSISSSDGNSPFALGLTTGQPGDLLDGAVGLLSVSAEATPFTVVQPTVVANPTLTAVADPVLIDHGSRLLYAEVPGSEDQGPAGEDVYALDITTGMRQLVTRVSGATGLGATSG